MSDLLRIALALTGMTVAAPARRSLADTAVALVAATFAASAVASAVACAAGALWMAMLPRTGPVGAPLIVAAALLVLALAALSVARRALRPRPIVPPVAADVSADALLAEVSRLVAAHKGPVLLAALLAGLAAGSRGTQAAP